MGDPSSGPAFPAGRSTVTVAEVAGLFGCTEQHVIDLIEEGRLQALDIGRGSRRCWRVAREGYEHFLSQRDSLGAGILSPPGKASKRPQDDPQPDTPTQGAVQRPKLAAMRGSEPRSGESQRQKEPRK